MANFSGHLTGSIAVGIAGAIYLHTDINQPSELATAVVLLSGIAGGLSPDIDLGGWKQASIPNKLAKAASFAVVATLAIKGSNDVANVAYALLAWLGAWILIDAIMAHRGHTHSWLGAVCFGAFFGWVAGLFAGGQVPIYAAVTAGMSYMGHLLLDDITSAARAGYKLKRMRMALVSIRPMFTGGNFLELAIVLVIGIFGFYGMSGGMR